VLVLVTRGAGTVLVARTVAMSVLILIQIVTAAMFVLTASHKKYDFHEVTFTTNL
jgi:hypothetical protein